jgi:hypothetical protein
MERPFSVCPASLYMLIMCEEAGAAEKQKHQLAIT